MLYATVDLEDIEQGFEKTASMATGLGDGADRNAGSDIGVDEKTASLIPSEECRPGKIEGTYSRGFFALAASNVLRAVLVEQILDTDSGTENSLKMLET